MLRYFSLFWLCLAFGCAAGGVDDFTADAGNMSDAQPSDGRIEPDGQPGDGSIDDADVQANLDGAMNVDSGPVVDAALEADARVERDAEEELSPDVAMPVDDAAEMVSATLPMEMNCGDVFAAEVTVRNTGQATWSRGADYKLGAVEDSDPFYTRGTRVWFSPEAIVPPGETYTFAFELIGPEEAGVYTTDWRMVHEGVTWFGEIVSQEVVVSCPMEPEPEPEERAPLPNERGVVDQLADERPDLLEQSCVEHGGNNDFLFELVRRLRARDTRWGLNWKRGNEGDLSQDIVDYYWGPGEPVEGSTDVYIIDIIGGHCPGPADPPSSPAWIDQTQPTADAGTIGRWTIRPLPE